MNRTRENPESLELNRNEIVTLSLLSTSDMYGYQMITEAKEQNKITLFLGSLYNVLHRLEKKGLIESYEKQDSSNKLRKYYKITAKGARTLEANELAWRSIWNMTVRPQ